MWVVYPPDELVQAEREEHAARQRWAEARERYLMDEGEAPAADHALIEKLEADWKRALERLRHTRARHQS